MLRKDGGNRSRGSRRGAARKPAVSLGQRDAETVKGGGLQGTHAVNGGGLGQLAGDTRGKLFGRGGGRHSRLAGGVAVAERAPDGEGDAGVLDVDEERPAVRGEGGVGELRVALDVAGELVDLAPGVTPMTRLRLLPSETASSSANHRSPQGVMVMLSGLSIVRIVALVEDSRVFVAGK